LKDDTETDLSRFSYITSKHPTVTILIVVYEQHFIPNLSALVTFVLNVVFLSAKVEARGGAFG
jgi:hypothetical protein